MGGRRRINLEIVDNKISLLDLLNTMAREIEELRNVATEMIADHATINAFQDEVVLDVAAAHVDMGNIETLINETKDDFNIARTQLVELHADVDRLNQLSYDGVISDEEASNKAAGLDIDDANTENAESNLAIGIRYKGAIIPIPIDAEMNISTFSINADEITQDKFGTGWVFGVTDGTIDMMAALDPEAGEDLIEALCNYSTGDQIVAYLAANEVVCIGAINVEEQNAAAFVWGTGDMAAATSNTYYDIIQRPKMLVAGALTATGGGTTTYDLSGTGVGVLGTGTRIAFAAEGPQVKASEVQTVATTNTGAWIVYGLANQVTYAKCVGFAYGTVAAANAAVRALVPNPLLPVIGWFTVQNFQAAAANFVMGTTHLDGVTDLTVTFHNVQPDDANTFEALGGPRSGIYPLMAAPDPSVVSATDLTHTVTDLGATVAADPLTEPEADPGVPPSVPGTIPRRIQRST